MQMDALAQQFYAFVDTPWVFVLLFVHSMLESCFLPGAHDIFLVAASLVKPEFSFLFAIFSALGSVCGGTCGYAIGRFGGRPVLVKIFGEKWVVVVERYFQKFGIWAVAIAGFTPIPYKIFAIAAGIFEMKIVPFVVVSLITRAMRFFLVSALVFYVGGAIKETLMDAFDTFTFIVIIVMFVGYVVWKILKKRRSAQGEA